MEKDLNKSEKNTTDEDDENNSNSKNTSKKVKKSDSVDNTKKRDKPSSFFVVSTDGDTVEQKKKNEEPQNQEVKNTVTGNLTEDEVHEVIQIIIDEREQSISDELAITNDGSSEELEAVAAGIFLESLRHEALSENEITPDTIDQVYLESLDDLDIQTEIDDSSNDGTNNMSTLNVATTGNTGNPVPSTPVNTIYRTTTTPAVSPPTPPTNPPAGQGGPVNIPSNQQLNNQSRQNRNIVPIPIPVPIDSGAALVAGTITGYILGRRSKKTAVTTNKVLIVDKKVENQVKQLQVVIHEKESNLRADVRKSWQSTDRSKVKPVIITERRKKRIELREELKRREELINNPKVEKIGNFSLPALKIHRERRLPDGTENHPKRKPVEIMTVTELLEKSGHVKFDGWQVDELFRANRITEKVLRTVTKEYLRNGPYKLTLAREVLSDPKIIAEKQKNIELLHQKKNSVNIYSQTQESSLKSNNNNFFSTPKNTNNQSSDIQQNNSKSNNKQSQKQKSKLPLPWIAAVTALAIFTAIILIYLG